MRVNRQRGFSLIEIMVAVVVASLLMVFVLGLMRVQMSGYTANLQVANAQQNVRAGFSYLETMLRQTCAGVSEGAVHDRTSPPGLTTRACFKPYDGATPDGTSFTSNGQKGPDAVELIGADGGPITTVTSESGDTLTVADVTGFAVGDVVLVSDMARAYLFKISGINTGTKTIAFGLGGQAIDSPPGPPTLALRAYSIINPWLMLRARAISIYKGATSPELMMDPDITGTNSQADAQPLVDGVYDFEIVLGVDSVVQDNVLAEASPASTTDEWFGNAAAETLTVTTPPTIAWQTTAGTSFRALRASLIVGTPNTYAGAPSITAPLENRSTSSWPFTSTTSGPRFRQLRMVVSPRAWNLTRE